MCRGRARGPGILCRAWALNLPTSESLRAMASSAVRYSSSGVGGASTGSGRSGFSGSYGMGSGVGVGIGVADQVGTVGIRVAGHGSAPIQPGVPSSRSSGGQRVGDDDRVVGLGLDVDGLDPGGTGLALPLHQHRLTDPVGVRGNARANRSRSVHVAVDPPKRGLQTGIDDSRSAIARRSASRANGSIVFSAVLLAIALAVHQAPIMQQREDGIGTDQGLVPIGRHVGVHLGDSDSDSDAAAAAAASASAVVRSFPCSYPAHDSGVVLLRTDDPYRRGAVGGVRVPPASPFTATNWATNCRLTLMRLATMVAAQPARSSTLRA